MSRTTCISQALWETLDVLPTRARTLKQTPKASFIAQRRANRRPEYAGPKNTLSAEGAIHSRGIRGGGRARLRGGSKGFLASLLCLFALALASLPSHAAEVIPPTPAHYFNDYAGVVPPDTATRLNRELEDFERTNSSQIVVVVYPKMQSDSSIEDYTVRVAEAWKVGQKEKNNGAVLFVFIQDRKMYLQVGYGLEGVLPDAVAKQIIDKEIKPRFRNGDYAGGLTAGVNAILAAVKGEYKGTGSTVYERQAQHKQSVAGIIVVLLFFGIFGLVIVSGILRGLSGGGYRRRSPWGGWTIGSGGWSSGGWGGGGGGGWSGGGGGFSGGGGSFGGGGAGGSW